MAHVRDLWTQPGRKGKGKRWQAIWQTPGGPESKTFYNRDKGLKYAQAQETDITRGAYVSPEEASITVGQFCDTWMKGYESRRPSTVRQARVHIKQIKEEFGRKHLAAVRPSRVEAWTARLKAEGYEPSYVYACYSRLSQIMRAAARDGLIRQSPCSREISPGMGEQRAYVITTEQLWQLHDAMPAYLRIAVLLGALAGLRVAEVCGARPQDADIVNDVFRPVVQYPAEPLKTKTSRTPVPFPHSLSVELLAHFALHPGKKTILCDELGNPVGPWRVERAVRSARAKVPDLPPKFRFHDLRHYLASFLIAQGYDVKVVQARMRHQSSKTTLDTYGHLWPDRDESSRLALEAIFDARPVQ